MDVENEKTEKRGGRCKTNTEDHGCQNQWKSMEKKHYFGSILYTQIAEGMH